MVVGSVVGTTVVGSVVGSLVGCSVGDTVVGSVKGTVVGTVVGMGVGQGLMGQGMGVVGQGPGGMQPDPVTCFEVVSQPHILQTVSWTVYVPSALKTWLGFCRVEVSPSPKSQDQFRAFVELSVNWMVNGGTPPVAFMAKSATGCGTGFTETSLAMVEFLLVPSLQGRVTVRLTV